VKGLWQDLGGIVLLEVCDANAPRAEVAHTVPVETPALSADDTADVPLFVKGGRSTASSWSITLAANRSSCPRSTRSRRRRSTAQPPARVRHHATRSRRRLLIDPLARNGPSLLAASC
jgi:hypothetical protein